MSCPCRSTFKFKECCLKKLPEFVPEKTAEQFKEQMKRPDFVFLTKENEAEIKADAKRIAECEKAKQAPN